MAASSSQCELVSNRAMVLLFGKVYLTSQFISISRSCPVVLLLIIATSLVLEGHYECE